MCILFFHFDPTHPRYIFIIASNRDEWYDRPTETVSFWQDRPLICAGRDAEPQRGGGTWLGISRHGNFATLTNYRINMEQYKVDALGRGSLVADFLEGSTQPHEYSSALLQSGDDYNGFNLLTAKLWGPHSKRKMCYMSNMEDKPCRILEPGFYGLSNRLLDSPWKKLVYGRDLFTDIVTPALSTDSISQEQLTEQLLQLLQNREEHWPDACVPDTGHSERVYKEWSTICVRSALLKDTFDYGTRTHSVILVGAGGEVSYTESTLTDFDSFSWDSKTIKFTLEDDSLDGNKL